MPPWSVRRWAMMIRSWSSPHQCKDHKFRWVDKKCSSSDFVGRKRKCTSCCRPDKYMVARWCANVCAVSGGRTAWTLLDTDHMSRAFGPSAVEDEFLNYWWMKNAFYKHHTDAASLRCARDDASGGGLVGWMTLNKYRNETASHRNVFEDELSN